MDHATTRKPGKTRIMVQLWDKLAEKVQKEFKGLHLKRDPYLNDLLTREIEELAREVTFKNSPEVKERLLARKLPNRVKWTIELDETTAARIDEVLKERNIPRDSFINRVLFFLVAKPKMIRALGIEHEPKHDVSAKPLDDAWGFMHDPFFHIRYTEENREHRCYTLSCFEDGPLWGAKNAPNLFALNTAITPEDWERFNQPPLDFDDFEIGLTTSSEGEGA